MKLFERARDMMGKPTSSSSKADQAKRSIVPD
jgi:hypothetical protein